MPRKIGKSGLSAFSSDKDTRKGVSDPVVEAAAAAGKRGTAARVDIDLSVFARKKSWPAF